MLHDGGKKIAFLIIENKEVKFPQAFLFRISSWTGNLPTKVYTNLSWCGANLDSLIGTLVKYEIYYLKLLWQSKSYINMVND